MSGRVLTGGVITQARQTHTSLGGGLTGGVFTRARETHTSLGGVVLTRVGEVLTRVWQRCLHESGREWCSHKSRRGTDTIAGGVLTRVREGCSHESGRGTYTRPGGVPGGVLT